MRTILNIIHMERKTSKKGDEYHLTHALLDDGTEAIGYGTDFVPTDKVEVFFHYNKIKMRKSLDT